MIKRIRCKNFESHEDTEMFFGDGFNCVFGESNVGKSSGVIRTLKLVAYNQFDKKMVRLGAKHLEVEVETDKGIVRVCRGEEINEWWITKAGVTEHLVKPGSKPIPQAIEVLGFGPVDIGEMKIFAHLMDQLEAHFLISAVGSEKTSGSSRAQVIDDISGLRGAEKLIQDIAGDMSKINRAEKEDMERVDELSVHIIPELVLSSEEAMVKLNEDRLKEVDSCLDKVAGMIKIAQSFSKATKESSELSDRVRGLVIPDLDELVETAKKISSLSKLRNKYSEIISGLEVVGKVNKNIPDITELESVARKIAGIVKITKKYGDLSNELERFSRCNKTIPDISEIEGIGPKVQLIRKKVNEHKNITSGLALANSELSTIRQDLENSERKLRETMMLVEVCPVSGKVCNILKSSL